MKKTICTIVMVIFLATGFCHANTVTFREGLDGYAGTQDTWFSSRTTGGENLGFPEGTYFRTALWSSNQQALLRFDGIFDNDGGPITLGATINSATLTVQVPTDIQYSDGEANAIHKMLVDWAETDAYGATPWVGGATQQIDLDDTEAASTTVDDSTEYAVANVIPQGATLVFDVTSIVQDWSDGDGNFGFLFQSLGLAAGNGLYMASSEYNGSAGVTARPTLEISYGSGPSLVIAQTGGTTNVVEGGATDSYTVALSSQPGSDVQVSISDLSDPIQVTILPETLTFTSANWSTAQTVTVTAHDDSDAEGNHSTTLIHNATSGDSSFNGLSSQFMVSITDNDALLSLKKGPYLIYPGDNTQMTVLWQLDTTASCTLEWGEDTNYNSGSVVTDEYGSDHQHKYTITNLKSGITYYYRVVEGSSYYPAFFRTAPRDFAQNVKFLAYSDTQDYPDRQEVVCTAVVDTITADPNYQTFIAHAGDWVNYDSEAAWSGQFFDRSYQKILEMQNKIPIQGCPGNHEFWGSSAVVFNKYWPFAYVNPTDGLYFSFDYGPAHIVCLDMLSYNYPTDYDFSPAQIAWLESDLQATDKQWIFLALHRPGWSAGHSPGHEWWSENSVNVQNKIQPLCETYGVDIVFCGHYHYYARCEVNGVQHVTTAIGGGASYPGAGDDPPYLVIGPIQELGFCKVDIQGNTLNFEAVKANDGSLLDSFTITNALEGDVNGNGCVDLFDYADFSLQWLENNCQPFDACLGADVNLSGDVDLVDLKLLTDNWLNCPVLTDSSSIFITEFMAVNDSLMTDGDGDFSDWIEIYNADTKPVNLYKWYLTNDSNDLQKWQFPSVELYPGEFLVVYASGKDRALAGKELHTNFTLNDSGGYLALVNPDGSSVVHEYAPTYPAQSADVSYGLPMSTSSVELVSAGDTAKVHIPTDDTLGNDWLYTGFVDSGWTSGPTGVGYGSIYSSLIETDVELLMDGVNDTAYIRIPFDGDITESLYSLRLKMKYVDGFVAYLNGQEIARRNAPQNPQWNSSATDTHIYAQAIVYENIDVSNHLDLLQSGTNILAIHGLKASAQGSSGWQNEYTGSETGTTALWNFNSETAGVVSDDSGNGWDLTLIEGAALTDTGKFGKALNNTAAGRAYRAGATGLFPASGTDDGNITIEAWINLSQADIDKDFACCFSYGSRNLRVRFFNTSSNNEASFRYYDGSNERLSNILPWQVNTWYHVAVTLTDADDTVRFYRDGLPVGSYTYGTDQTFGGNWGGGENLTVGNYGSGGSWHTSFVDCVRISALAFDSGESSFLILPVLEGEGVVIDN